MFGWSKNEVVSIPHPELQPLSMVDCSWCAAETGQECSESPTICTRHEAEMLAEAEARRAERERKEAA